MTTGWRLRPGDKLYGGGFIYAVEGKWKQSGGGGTLYRLQDPHGDRLAKLFHKPSRCDVLPALMEKLREAQLDAAYNIAAPMHQVRVKQTFAGFAMHLFDDNESNDQDRWLPLSNLFGSNRDLGHRLAVARDLAERTERVHLAKFIIGDSSPPNLLWNSNKATCALIDVDSWGYDSTELRSVKSRLPPAKKSGLILPCGEETPRAEYMPNGNIARDQVSRATDRYALGLMIFEILLGEHAFGPQRINEPLDKLDNMTRGNAWIRKPVDYNLNRHQFPHGHPGFDVLSSQIQVQVRKLLAGETPLIRDWLAALAESPVVDCKRCSAIIFDGQQCVSCWRTYAPTPPYHNWRPYAPTPPPGPYHYPKVLVRPPGPAPQPKVPEPRRSSVMSQVVGYVFLAAVVVVIIVLIAAAFRAAP